MANTPEKVTPKKADEWRPVFLSTLRNTGNVRAACQATGITRKTAYQHRNQAPEFAAAWDEALEDAIDALEAVAINRARTSSDTLLIFLLKAHRPGLYRDTSRVLNFNVTPDDLKQMDEDDLDELERKLTSTR